MPFQILSRAQGQLNTLTGQVASMKAMTEATTSVQNNLSCVDSANMPQVIPQNDATILSSGQSLANGGPNASTSIQVDNPAMAVADNTCNGSGILVFQQKSSGTINNATSTNVPVLVSLFAFLYFMTQTYTLNLNSCNNKKMQIRDIAQCYIKLKLMRIF